MLLALLVRPPRTASFDWTEWPELERGVAVAAAGGAADVCGVTRADLREAAQILAESILKVLVFNRDYRGARTAGDERLFAEAAAALGCSVLALREKSNMQGLLDMGANPAWLPGYVADERRGGGRRRSRRSGASPCATSSGAGATSPELLRQKKIKVAIVLGEDPLGSEAFPQDLCDGLCAADFLVVADLFLTATAALANVVLPLSQHGRDERDHHQLRAARAAAHAAPSRRVRDGDLADPLRASPREMGYRFKMKYASVDEVTAEIRRVVPIYRDVVVDGNRRGRDLGPRSVPDRTGQAGPSTPRANRPNGGDARPGPPGESLLDLVRRRVRARAAGA